MAGKRKNIVRYKDVYESTYDLDEGVARKYLASALGVKRLTWCEPARGATVGAPDCWIYRGEEYAWLPTELKKSFKYMHQPGDKLAAKYVQVRHVQPAQLNWHMKAKEVGATTIILVLLDEGTSWETSYWAICMGYEIANWREGMRIYQTVFGKGLAKALGCEAAY
jgi:hypothetical protein